MSNRLIRTRRWLLLFVASCLLMQPIFSVYAMNDATLDNFAANNIMFYDPESCGGDDTSISVNKDDLPEETVKILENADVVAKAEQNMSAYVASANANKIPWQVLAAIHFREAGMASNKSLSNGDPLGSGTNVDGIDVQDNLTDDAIDMGEHYVSMGKMVYGVDVTSEGATIDDYGQAFLAYNRGWMYKNPGVDWHLSPYVMNYLDEDHIKMTWQHEDSYAGSVKRNNLEGTVDSNVGALAVFIYLGGGAAGVSGSTKAVTWDDDGWVSGNLSGYAKEEATGSAVSGLNSSFGTDFTTKLPKDKEKSGPDKITLSLTESDDGGDGSLLDLYAGSGLVPHFTVDLKNNKISQHGSILKVAGRTSSSATEGVQIAIVGYSLSSEDPYIGNFTEDNWKYLARLIIAVRREIGLKEDSAISSSALPSDTVSLINRAISAVIAEEKDNCGGNDSTAVGALREWVKKLVNPTYIKKGDPGAMEVTDTYREIASSGKYYRGSDAIDGSAPGLDCHGFVNILVHVSGWDKGYMGGKMNDDGTTYGTGGTGEAEKWLDKPENGWKDVTSEIKSNDDAKPGDVLICNGPDCGHTLIFVGKMEDFFTNKDTVMVSASQYHRAPMADSKTSIMQYINTPPYRVFRKVK